MLYKGKFRVSTTRLKSWDYASNGCYFITICTANRQLFFGEIVEQQMALSEIGVVAHDEWLKSAELRANIELDAFVIMPNHMHGIVFVRVDEDAQQRVSTQNKFGPLAHGSLQAVINGYKGSVTRWCKNNHHPEFEWQPRFWERIIRNARELQATRVYIENNIQKWALDKENTPNLWM